MRTYQFKATLIHDDKRTGFRKGKKFDPLGFYYSGKKVILVGSVSGEHATRMVFPIDSVDIEVIGAKTSVVLLVCKDASKDDSTYMFSRVLPSVQAAKDYAKKYQSKVGWPPWAQWQEGAGRLTCDTGHYLWIIEEQKND